MSSMSLSLSRRGEGEEDLCWGDCDRALRRRRRVFHGVCDADKISGDGDLERERGRSMRHGCVGNS